jgi:hypothetical protein
MNLKERSQIAKDAFERRLVILDGKGKEYANGEDANGNFKRLAPKLGLTPEQILWVYTAKHIDSIETWLRTGDEGMEGIIGRLDDLRNYVDILESLIVEKKNGL